MINILFVCHGNICRSPMAEFVMKDLVCKNGREEQFCIASAATSTEEIGNDIHYGTRSILKKHGIPFEKRRAVRITKSDYDKYDYIIGMDSANIRNMRRIFGEDTCGKLSLLLSFAEINRDVADPWYTGDFDTAYSDIQLGCRALFEKIINL